MKEKYTKKSLYSKTNLNRLHDKDDSDIDYQDNPATNKKFWENAKVFAPQHKVHISLRLDENVVDFFKEQGIGYQTRINAVLKAYVYANSCD